MERGKQEVGPGSGAQWSRSPDSALSHGSLFLIHTRALSTRVVKSVAAYPPDSLQRLEALRALCFLIHCGVWLAWCHSCPGFLFPLRPCLLHWSLAFPSSYLGPHSYSAHRLGRLTHSCGSDCSLQTTNPGTPTLSPIFALRCSHVIQLLTQWAAPAK